MIKTLVLRDHSSLSDQAVPFKKICRWQVVFFQNCRLLNSLTDLPFRNGIYKEPISRQISVPLALPFSSAAPLQALLFLNRSRKLLSAMAGVWRLGAGGSTASSAA